MAHAFFAPLDWRALLNSDVPSPFVPTLQGARLGRELRQDLDRPGARGLALRDTRGGP